jgi:hypothetical protein
MFDFYFNAIGRVIGAGAFACGLATWIVLAIGLSYCRFFLPDALPNPKAIMTVRTAGQLTVTTASAIVSGAGLSLSFLAFFIGQTTVWAWMALGMSAAFWVISGLIMYLYHHPLW